MPLRFLVGAMETRSKRTQDILELIQAGYSAKQVAGLTDCTVLNVYATAKRYGIELLKAVASHTEEERQKVCEYRIQGHTVRETAEHFGVKFTWVKKVSRNIAKPVYKKPDDFIDHVKDIIARRANGFEYVGNYTGSEGTVDLRCKTCGTVVSKSWTSVKHGTASCAVCADVQRDRRTAERNREREQQSEQKRMLMDRQRADRKRELARLRAEKREARKHPCKVCGTITTNRCYCSDRCANRVDSKRKEVARRIKIKTAMVDRDITLERLFDRDKGVCHICGMLCNYDDIETAGETMIAGDFYPSIDHVIPLAKGGTHAWSNVKLAHRKCNYIKCDSVY